MANLSVTFFDSVTYPVTLPYTSDEAKGCGYYGKSGGVHTVQYTVVDFVGLIKIQATLATTPTEDDWFDVDNIQYEALTSTSDTTTQSFSGNFVWVRAVTTVFSEGSINRVQYNHN